jgi:hypothetical protein
VLSPTSSLFGWLVADGWCWFVLREEYCWLVAGGWFVLREKYCWLVADKPSEQGPPSAAPDHLEILDALPKKNACKTVSTTLLSSEFICYSINSQLIKHIVKFFWNEQ